MSRDYSIADAKDHFAEAVRTAEGGDAVTLTRRGKPVAVLLSIDDYRRLEQPRPDFWKLSRDLRREAVREGTPFNESDFDGLRDPSPGRAVDL